MSCAELQGWSKLLFNPEAGGGALVGISWLPLVLGPWFAWKLARSERAPQSPWRVAGLDLGTILLAFVLFRAAAVAVAKPKPVSP